MAWPQFFSCTVPRQRIRTREASSYSGPIISPFQQRDILPVPLATRRVYQIVQRPLMSSARRAEGHCYVCQAHRIIRVDDTTNPWCEQCGHTFVEIGQPGTVSSAAIMSNPFPSLLNAFFGPQVAEANMGHRQGDYNQFGGNQLSSIGPLENFLGTFLDILNERNMNNILNHLMQNDPNKYGPPPAAETVRNELPREELTSLNAVGICAVCQDEFKAGDICTRLTTNKEECGHMFHDQCLMPWLKAHNTCPVCRYELLTDDPAYEARKAQLRGHLQRNLSTRNQAQMPQQEVADQNVTATRVPRPYRHVQVASPRNLGHNPQVPQATRISRIPQRNSGTQSGFSVTFNIDDQGSRLTWSTNSPDPTERRSPNARSPSASNTSPFQRRFG